MELILLVLLLIDLVPKFLPSLSLSLPSFLSLLGLGFGENGAVILVIGSWFVVPLFEETEIDVSLSLFVFVEAVAVGLNSGVIVVAVASNIDAVADNNESNETVQGGV